VNTRRALYFTLVVALIRIWIDSSFVNQEQPTGSDSWELSDWTTDRRGTLGAKGRVALTGRLRNSGGQKLPIKQGGGRGVYINKGRIS
jgi:hypothetical protein